VCPKVVCTIRHVLGVLLPDSAEIDQPMTSALSADRSYETSTAHTDESADFR